ncbi:hypothetical protein [Mycolicibacter senuensis]|uniref:hypothetical protein n=1 Tax=Mycolicibacter senuensis TaxID=386913 RepID=UPI000DCD50B2|nr:hypothetical protein [Mycolicibacter senuensis]RAU99474.1 hypothetical protein DQP56_10670 [Mycolicibacter senuensis]
MAETPDTPDTTTEAAEAPSEAPEAQEGQSDATDNPNREAAKWRTKLRDTEAERDALAERLAAAQRQNVTTTVAQHFRDASDFWSTTDLADVLDDEGNVDTERLTTAVNATLAAKPHWRKPASVTESTSIVTGNDPIGPGKPEPSFADAFRPPNMRSKR